MSFAFPPDLDRFRRDYAEHRAAEGRTLTGDDMLRLPWLRTGPLARQWQVRARSYEALVKTVVRPLRLRLGRPLRVLDLGAGNGWLSYRLALQGDACTALDIREDSIDGLGAADLFLRHVQFARLISSFDAVPLPASAFDLVLFNASLHYSTDLRATLREACRLLASTGQLAILDSPFYDREVDGEAMVAEKHAGADARFGERSGTLLALPFIEFLTAARLAAAAGQVLQWRRRRVVYPLWYELRPLGAFLRGKRAPSRFDLWTARLL